MKFNDLLLSKRAGVATVTLNRPDRLNALGDRTTLELCGACEDAIKDPRIRVLVLTGAGSAFCAGGDFKDTFASGFEKTALEWRHRIRTGPNRLVSLLSGSEKPVVASVNGVAVGGGSTIALACDIRIASEKARFGLVFSKIGATPEFGCSYLLPRIVGLGKALDLLLTADLIDAHEAQRIGLVSKVVPHDDLREATGQLVDKLLQKPPAALGLIKSMIYRSLSMDMLSVLELEALALGTAFKTEEHQEAVQAFLRKKRSKKKPKN